MSPIREQYLSLAELEDLIQKFEGKYGISTNEFLKNPEVRVNMPEDDVFQWEAFDAHRDELQRMAVELKSRYLKSVTKTDDSNESPRNTNLALAA